MMKLIFLCIVSLFLLFESTLAAGLNLDRSFAPMLIYNQNVSVSDIVVQPDGKFIVSGNMYMIDNRQVNSLARYNADGTIDTMFDAAGVLFNTGNEVFLALQPDGKIIAGSFFSIAGGQPRLRLARLNQNGSFDSSFNVTSILANAPAVSSVAVQPDGKIIAVIASGFQINNSTQSIARLNPDGSVDASFVPFTNTFFPSKIYIQPDGKILVVGLGTINGQTRNIVRLDASGALDTTFNVTLNIGGAINAASTLPSGKIVIGGNFSTVSGQTRTRLARINADGSLDASFGDNPNRIIVQRIGYQSDGKVIYCSNDQKFYRDNADGTADDNFATLSRILDGAKSFAVLPDNRIAGGGNVRVSNVSPPNFVDVRHQPIVLLAADGTINDQFRPNVLFPRGLGDIADIAIQPDGKVLIGSSLTSDSNTQANTTIRSLARLNTNGTFDSTFVFPTTYLTGGSRVTQVELLADGKILIGTLAPGGNKAVARLNADGTPDASFSNVTIAGLDRKILDMIVQTDGKILIRGSFNQIQGQPRAFIARLNADGSLDTGFNPLFTDNNGSTASAIITGISLQPDGKIVVTGNFNKVNGTAQQWQTRLNTDGSLDPSLISSPFSSYDNVLSLQPDGKQIRTRLGNVLRYNPDGSLDNSFTRLTFYQATNVTGTINGAITLSNGKIFVYGNFTYVNTSGNPNVYAYAVLNADGTLERSSIVKTGAENSPNVLTAKLAADNKIYIGGGFTFVNQISQPAMARLNAFQPKASAFDFDGDGKADVSVFRSGTWYINPSSALFDSYGIQFGLAGDTLAPADYDGDGKTDIAVWRAGNFAYFYILQSSTNTVRIEQFGQTGDNPTISGDWDGDGKSDPAVYRVAATNGEQSFFYYRPSSQSGVNFIPVQWGTTGDTPISGDFDGDGKLDATVYRPSDNTFYVRQSATGTLRVQQWGNALTDAIFAGDFDGDGKSDFALQRFSGSDAGTWYVLQSVSSPAVRAVRWGIGSDVPVPADYTGDGKTDFAVFRRSDQVWYILDGASGAVSSIRFGANSDFPIPLNLVR